MKIKSNENKIDNPINNELLVTTIVNYELL